MSDPVLDLPVAFPVKPILAKLVRSMPEGDYLYEPKWDGFRCLVFRDGDTVVLQSRNAKPQERRFWLEAREGDAGTTEISAAGAGLDPAMLEHPEQALACARREAFRLGDITESLFTRAMQMFEAEDRSEIEQLVEADREINSRNKAIHRYLSETRRHVAEPQMEQQLDRLLHFASNMENIGDIISHDLARLAVKRLDRGVIFSSEGYDELSTIHREVLALLKSELNRFAAGNAGTSDKLRNKVEDIRSLCDQSVARHRRRLSDNRSSSIGTSSIHQDTVRDLLQVALLLEHQPELVSPV